MLLKIVTYKKYKNFIKSKLEPNQTISPNLVYELNPPQDFIVKTLIKIQKILTAAAVVLQTCSF